LTNLNKPLECFANFKVHTYFWDNLCFYYTLLLARCVHISKHKNVSYLKLKKDDR